MMRIFYKIRKHGIMGSIKIGLTLCYYFFFIKIPWLLKFRFYHNLLRLIFTPAFRKKRILGIWDFKVLPWSVGDPLVFVETLSILKIKHEAEEIDICIVYDRENPGGLRGKRIYSNINPENAQDYMLEFLPLFSTCPYLDSIYQFSSRKEFYGFLKTNIGHYDTFPPIGKHLGEEYNLSEGSLLDPISEFHNIHGYIPYLRIGDRDSAWAQWFYLNHLSKRAVPVAISLKRTLHRVESNADPEVWLSFIDMCKSDFPEVVFVIVGLREEALADLRNRSNVIMAKDFGTSIIEDLALIRASLMYMGTNSGVNVIAMFSDLPYLITQFEVSNLVRHRLKPGDKYPFMSDTQKIVSAKTILTAEFLFKEFKALYLKLDKNKWYGKTLKKACNKHGHPAAQV